MKKRHLFGARIQTMIPHGSTLVALVRSEGHEYRLIHDEKGFLLQSKPIGLTHWRNHHRDKSEKKIIPLLEDAIYELKDLAKIARLRKQQV